MKILKLKYLFSGVLLSIGFSSCIQKEEMTETNRLFKKIESGKANQSDLNKLIESVAGVDGFDVPIQPDGGKFKLVFPVITVKNKVVKQIIDGEIVEYYQYNANLQGKDHPNLAHQIMYSFMPDVKSEKDINLIFDGQREYLLSGTNSKLEFELLDDTKGVPGRHLYMTIDDSNLKTNVKMYFKNGIYYQLAVVTENGHLFNSKISEFFDSFEMLD
jgi:hypothetical protein